MQNVKRKPKHRPFCFRVKGHVKMLQLDIINSLVTAIFMIIISVLALIPETTTCSIFGGGLIIGALAYFTTSEAPELHVAITVLGIFIVLFFILLYVLTLHHLLTYFGPYLFSKFYVLCIFCFLMLNWLPWRRGEALGGG